MSRTAPALGVLLLLISGSGGITQTPQLTFADRVKAQEAIERVYYSHQIGLKSRFEEMVPRSLLVDKVRTYLRQSTALEQFWRSPITAEALERELHRMADQSRMPERLAELYAALDNDTILIQECLVRPVLVGRLAHNFYSSDERIHGATRRQAEQFRERLVRGDIDSFAEQPHRAVFDLIRTDGRRNETPVDDAPREVGMSSEEFDTALRAGPSRPGETGPIVEEPERFIIRIALEADPGRVRLASYTFRKLSWDAWWEQVEDEFDAQGVQAIARPDVVIPAPGTASSPAPGSSSPPCQPDDVWENGSLDTLPAPNRSNHTAIWTGNVMIVWGGVDSANFRLDSGGRYDPSTDTWRSISRTNAPAGRESHGAVWTGTRMLVWGGFSGGSVGYANDGGAYDPITDTWVPITSAGAPVGVTNPRMVWTGSRLLVSVWGGSCSSPTTAGGIYDPATDAWTSITRAEGPELRGGHSAVWTGSRMIVWGGEGCASDLGDGGSYDPNSNSWTLFPAKPGSPSPRKDHSAVWTGNRMVIWGGNAGSNVNSGAIFDPSIQTWTPISLVNAPAPRADYSTVWTGSEMLIWGGGVNTGGHYNPTSNIWSPTDTVNAPTARTGQTAIWSGSLMVVWGGGVFPGDYPGTGGRYDPLIDSWTPTAASNAPPGRTQHSAIWTGSLMIIYGGGSATLPYFNSGGRYDPALDYWSAIPAFDGPDGRALHTAVWAGDRMLIWGGQWFLNSSTIKMGSGGQYFPASNSWSPISTAGAPGPRSSHTAVWTGLHMIVWGGGLNTGGRYDPGTNTWQPTSTTNAPSARDTNTAVWDGGRMIVWGGQSGGVSLNTGGLYDPAADAWAATSQTNAPSARKSHTAVWSGSRMIVWGGYSGSGPNYMNTGAQYEPATGIWTPTSTSGAPAARRFHTALWAGSRMIVWGGALTGPGSAGGRYYPDTGVWLPTSIDHAPGQRFGHTAVWTGSSMIVWGGLGGTYLDSGGRYLADQSADDDTDGFGVCGGDCDDTHGSVYPGALQACDGLNNNCSDPAWPSLAGTNEADNDGDGLSVCQNDCNDADASVWTTPGEVQDLSLSQDQPSAATILSWMTPANPGGLSVVYDTLGSGSAADFAGSGVCFQSDGTSTTSTDTTALSAGGILYFLVRAENSCPGAAGIGPLGAGSNGAVQFGRTCP